MLLVDLPVELICYILEEIDGLDLLHCSRVSWSTLPSPRSLAVTLP